MFDFLRSFFLFVRAQPTVLRHGFSVLFFTSAMVVAMGLKNWMERRHANPQADFLSSMPLKVSVAHVFMWAIWCSASCYSTCLADDPAKPLTAVATGTNLPDPSSQSHPVALTPPNAAQADPVAGGAAVAGETPSPASPATPPPAVAITREPAPVAVDPSPATLASPVAEEPPAQQPQSDPEPQKVAVKKSSHHHAQPRTVYGEDAEGNRIMVEHHENFTVERPVPAGQ